MCAHPPVLLPNHLIPIQLAGDEITENYLVVSRAEKDGDNDKAIICSLAICHSGDILKGQCTECSRNSFVHRKSTLSKLVLVQRKQTILVVTFH